MNTDALELIGLSKEQLQDRVIERIAGEVVSDVTFSDEDGMDVDDTPFGKKLKALVEKRIDDQISAIAEAHVLPRVSEFIETLTLQETNDWGEKKGTAVTFIEYLIARANAYMMEKVTYDGKSKDENGSYSFTGTQTRITFLIHKHLHYSIETAMKEALNLAVGSVAKGIHETARLKLNEIASQLTVSVKAGR